MLLKLCLVAGQEAIRDPDAFRESMSDQQFAEWCAFYDIDPWDGFRTDVALGIVGSTIANVNRDRKAHPDPFTIGQFCHDWEADPEDPEQRTAATAEELDEKAGQVIAVMRAFRGNHDRQSGAEDHGGSGGPESEAR